MRLSSWAAVERHGAAAETHFRTKPYRALSLVRCEDVLGTNSRGCRDCWYGFDLHESEAMRYCSFGEFAHHSMDCYGFGQSNHSYESTILGRPGTDVLFTAGAVYCSDLLYCSSCYLGSQNCFGCCGLKKKQYCVFNRQYSPEDYVRLVRQIVEHMQQTGEWGEFFPPGVSPFGYNETVAQEHYPRTEVEVRAEGYQWCSYESPMPTVTAILEAADLADDLEVADSAITQVAIRCASSGRLYRVIAPELAFYKRQGIPLPRCHPDVRHRRRVERRTPRGIWHRQCAQCERETPAAYPKDAPMTVYCEECYCQFGRE